jgi:hypothetical protein
MRALIFGNLRNTLGSTSMAVEAGSPVMGHLIITELIATISPEDVQRNTNGTLKRMQLSDRDQLKTAYPSVDKVAVIEKSPEPTSGVRVDRGVF